MKKKLLIATIAILIVGAGSFFISDGLIYLIISLMALLIMGTIHVNRTLVMKITRWSKANPGKIQVFITLLQICLIVLGILGGYNLKMIGYELSSTTALVFGTLLVAGFFSVHFLPKHSHITIPAKVNKNRLSFMCIALSSFVLMLIAGNRLEDQYPNSLVTSVVRAIDHSIFNDDAEYTNTAFSDNPEYSSVAAAFTTNPKHNSTTLSDFIEKVKAKLLSGKKVTSLERKKVRMLNKLEKRLAFSGGTSFGAVMLIILLVITACAGVCLIIGGASGGGVGLIPLGAAIAAGSIYGIVKIGKLKKSEPAKK